MKISAQSSSLQWECAAAGHGGSCFDQYSCQKPAQPPWLMRQVISPSVQVLSRSRKQRCCHPSSHRTQSRYAPTSAREEKNNQRCPGYKHSKASSNTSHQVVCLQSWEGTVGLVNQTLRDAPFNRSRLATCCGLLTLEHSHSYKTYRLLHTDNFFIMLDLSIKH